MNLKQFILNECANCFSTDPGYRPALWCEPRDKPCQVLVKTPERCRYFEGAVLPIDRDHGGEYAQATTPAPELQLFTPPPDKQMPRRRAVAYQERVGVQ